MLSGYGVTVKTQRDTTSTQHGSGVTIRDVLTLLIGMAIPVTIGVYTTVVQRRLQISAKLLAEEEHRIASERREFDLKRADELYQRQLYKNFLDDMYTLHKDGELNKSAESWVFANARYRAAHREFDSIRKVHALQFLKEKGLIGCQTCSAPCLRKNITSIIRLERLNFDNLTFSGNIGSIRKVDLTCVEFNFVSMTNTTLSHINFNGAVFNNSRLDGTTFIDCSLNCSIIQNTAVNGTDFRYTTLYGARFIDVDDSKAILTDQQREQLKLNEILITTTRIPVTSQEYTSAESTSMTAVETLLITSTITTMVTNLNTRTTVSLYSTITTGAETISSTISSQHFVSVRWEQNGTTVAGGHGKGSNNSQLNEPLGLFIDDDDDQTMIIADRMNHRIIQWRSGDVSGQVVAGGNVSGSGLDRLFCPSDVLIDKTNNTLIIADHQNRRIVRWSRVNGTLQGKTLISNIGGWGLAMDEKRNLYVCDFYQNEVRRYDIDRGDKNGTVVAGGNDPGIGLEQLRNPKYIFVDKNQSLYVSDWQNHRVMKWDKDAKKGILVAGGRGKGKNLTQVSLPLGIFVDRLGTLYVAEEGNARITAWYQGSEQGTVVVNEAGSRIQLDGPAGLSFDKHGNLFVVDSNNYRVQRYNLIK